MICMPLINPSMMRITIIEDLETCWCLTAESRNLFNVNTFNSFLILFTSYLYFIFAFRCCLYVNTCFLLFVATSLIREVATYYVIEGCGQNLGPGPWATLWATLFWWFYNFTIILLIWFFLLLFVYSYQCKTFGSLTLFRRVMKST